MKKIFILLFAILSIGLQAQVTEKWVDTDSLNTEKIVFKGNEIDSIYGDTVHYSAYSGHSVNADTSGYLTQQTEIISRTIYVLSTGDDETGTGEISTPFATIERGLQDIKDILQNVTLTLNVGIGTYNWNTECINEVNRIEAYNSTLEIASTAFTVIENGFTLSKIASRLFAYNLTKSALTATENQYLGLYMVDATATEFYPICHNNAGSSPFEIEFTNNNKASCNAIASQGTILNNSDSYKFWLDFDFKISVNSEIDFKFIQFNSSVVSGFINGFTYKYFVYCKFYDYPIDISTAQSARTPVRLYFDACQFYMPSYSSGGIIFLYNVPAWGITFRQCFFKANNTTEALITLTRCDYLNLQAGNYFYSKPTVSVFWFNGNNKLTYHKGIVVRDANSVIRLDYSSKFTPTLAGSSNPSFEFINVNSIFENLPLYSVEVNIPLIYGSTPANIYKGLTSGPLIDIKQEVTISISGIETGGTATLSGGTITVNSKAVASNSLIVLTPQNAGSAQGSVYISSRVAGTSFTITSTNGSDDRLIGWQIIKN